MSKNSRQCAPRAYRSACATATLLIGICSASLFGSQITETDDFSDVAKIAMDYADQVGPEHVLLVLDLDNTLLAMRQPMGSDQWYEWQRYLIQHEPHSPDAVADSFEGLLDAQGLLYNLGRMRPTQKDLPILMSRLQGRGIYTMVLTSRGDEYRVATERELRRNGYDIAASALPVRDGRGGTYLPFDPDNPDADGLTEKDLRALRLGKPKPVSYADGIMMTSGQNKGGMLLTLLHRAAVDIDAVVFDDDQMHNVAFVFAALVGHGKEITAVQYTHEAATMQRFEYGDKSKVTRRWRKLNRVLDEVFENGE